jgi:polysaccharide biosynthesis protein PslH
VRVLWLSHYVPWPPKGGVLQRGYHLLREAGRRHDVKLVALNQRVFLPSREQLQLACQELQKSCSSVDVFPIPSERSQAAWFWMSASGFFRSASYDSSWLRSRALREHLRERAAAERFDLVHLDTIGLLQYADLFPATPLVLNHHNVESQMMAERAAREPSPWRRVYYRRDARKLAELERRAARICRGQVVVSALDADRLRGNVGDVPTVVVDNGVDTDYFAPSAQPPRSPEALVFAGGLDWYPNRDAMQFFVREIWPPLRAALPGCEMTIIGRRPSPELQAAARDPRLRVTGFVDDVRPYLADAALYVCPIRQGGGTRLKVLDALAAGKALVATRFAVEGLGLEEERHYLAAESPADYVAQIGRASRDPALRERLAAAGRAHVEQHFAWTVIGAKLARAYEEASALPS